MTREPTLRSMTGLHGSATHSTMDQVTAMPSSSSGTTRVTCHAPHPDARRAGDPCGSLIGDVPGDVEFVTTADRAPAAPDGEVWLLCPRRNCGKWNRFRIVLAVAA